MNRRVVAVLAVLLSALYTNAADAPAPRDVAINASDGTPIKATYYAAAKHGPAVMLLHMCNTDRKSWQPLATKLSAAGIHALAMDYRGFGESGGDRNPTPEQAQKIVNEKWPGDVDAAYAFLLSQPGVDKNRIGAAGGSCGVNQAVQLARRHPGEIKALALLAGPTDLQGMTFLEDTHWLPIFAAGAADDQFDSDAPANMEWILLVSGNPRNRFSGFKDGKHGTEIFGPHPELVTQMVAWYEDTLVKHPADPKVAATPKSTPQRDFWMMAQAPGGADKAVQAFHEARKKDPKAQLFREGPMNLLGYEKLQAKQNTEAIELFKLNTEAFPTSANTYDSLGDAYLADGQKELALQASKKAIEMLANDTVPEDRKKLIQQSAEQKIAQLQSAK